MEKMNKRQARELLGEAPITKVVPVRRDQFIHHPIDPSSIGLRSSDTQKINIEKVGRGF